jgi:hypothetical protein
MDAYVYQAAFSCEDCIKQILIEKHLAPKNLSSADTLANVLHMHDYCSESDYDSDELPKGPYSEGGEADSPQHCDACGCFLENPLTTDGYRYVNEQLIKHACDGDGNAQVLVEWAKFYNACYYEPGEATLADIQFEYSMEDDDWGSAMGWWFTVAGDLYTRGAPIPDEWQYKPGIHPVDPDDRYTAIVASANRETLMRFMEDIEDDVKRLQSAKAGIISHTPPQQQLRGLVALAASARF